MFQGDLGRSGYNGAETTITPANALQLKLKWQVQAAGGISSQVVAANGMLYWGSWDGFEHATDLSGKPVWAFNLGQTSVSTCNPPTVGVASTAVATSVSINGVNTQVIFVGGGNGSFYALNAMTGQTIWSKQLGLPPNNFLWSSPIVYNGSVYEGVSSFGDCPLVRANLVMMNATTGTIQHTFYTMPSNCLGASIWASPTIDAQAGTLYLATGNPSTCGPKNLGQYFYSLVELNTTDLSLVHFWQIPPTERHPDNDFGSTPILFTASIGGVTHNLIGVLNKNGIYYTFDRADISKGPTIWKQSLANLVGNYAASAWDGTALYVLTGTTTVNGLTCKESLKALAPATGLPIWQTCWSSGQGVNAVFAVPGLVIVGQVHNLNVIDASSGKTLYSFVDPTKGSKFHAAPMISNGILYMGNSDGNLYALGL
ncbi:MAG: hypothetical protein NVS4B12_13170 [Ktedonobacteraceae bacterium]